MFQTVEYKTALIIGLVVIWQWLWHKYMIAPTPELKLALMQGYPNSWYELRDVKNLVELMKRTGRAHWRFITSSFGLAYIARQVVPLSGEFYMNLIAGALYGKLYGFVIVTFLTVSGSAVSFTFARYFFGPMNQRQRSTLQAVTSKINDGVVQYLSNIDGLKGTGPGEEQEPVFGEAVDGPGNGQFEQLYENSMKMQPRTGLAANQGASRPVNQGPGLPGLPVKQEPEKKEGGAVVGPDLEVSDDKDLVFDDPLVAPPSPQGPQGVKGPPPPAATAQGQPSPPFASPAPAVPTPPVPGTASHFPPGYVPPFAGTAQLQSAFRGGPYEGQQRPLVGGPYGPQATQQYQPINTTFPPSGLGQFDFAFPNQQTLPQPDQPSAAQGTLGPGSFSCSAGRACINHRIGNWWFQIELFTYFRLVPFMPSLVLNMGLAILGAGYRDLLLSTLLGSIPYNLYGLIIGSRLTELYSVDDVFYVDHLAYGWGVMTALAIVLLWKYLAYLSTGWTIASWSKMQSLNPTLGMGDPSQQQQQTTQQFMDPNGPFSNQNLSFLNQQQTQFMNPPVQNQPFYNQIHPQFQQQQQQTQQFLNPALQNQRTLQQAVDPFLNRQQAFARNQPQQNQQPQQQQTQQQGPQFNPNNPTSINHQNNL